MLPFETLDKAELNSVRLDLVHQLQCFNCSTEDIQTLRDILVDILNLQHGLEDNLLVIQQIQQVDPGTGEDYKELALNTARQHIIDINSVYQQGLDWLRNDQACDTLGSDNINEDIKIEIKEVPGLDFDELPSNCSEIKNNVVLTPRTNSEYDNLLPIDHEGIVSNLSEKNQQRAMSDGRKTGRGPNWSDLQTACFKSLITTLDGGDIYNAILSMDMTKEGKERKKRAWDRVLRKFRKIPGNEDFELKHLLSKYKNLKNRNKQLQEKLKFQADDLPHSPSSGLEWMRNDQSCDTHDAEEDFKVALDVDLNQIPSDNEEITEKCITDYDNLVPIGHEGNLSNIIKKNQQRVVSGRRKGRRAPNWSDQQAACLQDLITTLDGGDVYTAILSTSMTKEWRERKKRAWDTVYRMFRKIPGNEVFKLKHLFSKFKNLRNLNKELIEDRRFQAIQSDGLSHYPNNGSDWMMNDQSSDTLDSEEYTKVDSDHDMDQIFTDEEEITDQSNTECFPIDQEGNASNTFDGRMDGRMVNSVRASEKCLRGPNWSDQQAAFLQGLIKTLDGGDVYKAILSTMKTKENRKRKKRAWDRVYREFRQIPGNEVFKLNHLVSKFKNIRNFGKEISDEKIYEVVQANVPLPLSPHIGWMRNDQSCDALGSEEHIKVDPDQDIDQFSSDCLENQDNEERLSNSVKVGGKRDRSPNWSDEQTACLQDLIKSLDGGEIYTALLSTMKTKENRTRKKRAWDRVYREFRKMPGHEVFRLKHLVSKFKDIKNYKKEELVQNPDNTVCGAPSLSSPTEKDPIKPPPFSREQTRLLLEIVESVRVNQEQKEIIDSPGNKPELKEKKNKVWRNIHAQFIERSDCNLFSAQHLKGKYRNIVFQRGGQKNFDGSEKSLQNNPIQQLNTTYYRPILPKLPEENSPEFLEVPVKVEIHDGEEERNPLDVPVKVEIIDEEDPLQIL
ncbi:uncharacterized protein LOC111697239 isoform X2 [Eurytemora carolleeae]|uniref:uncharacterized protein LOC111697239 isoform X2 n=1 Tax=Eurytemora carolleeae TaxID=1294199 RepID=UPI000C76B18A|nr:uncharacterized protein LOC111697239 isoform X2 [Eurytemora carolleeae]|eukprot:XP_023322929.1 uncharacterized protein LOC111697239 isoform X2 [Eurytemora affinis]